MCTKHKKLYVWNLIPNPVKYCKTDWAVLKVRESTGFLQSNFSAQCSINHLNKIQFNYISIQPLPFLIHIIGLFS